jgi:hypothetical protein
MLAHRDSRRFSLRKSIVKLIGITLALTVLMGNWGPMEVEPKRFPIAHAAQGDQPLVNARDAQGRFIIPRGQPIQSFDGEVGPEWNDANLLTERPFHDVENESRTFPTRIWIKHDGRDLYFACEVELPSAWNDFWFFIMLDKDGDRSVLTPGANDDYLQVPVKGRAVPRPTDLHYDSAVDRFVPDVNKRGTNDIDGGGREVRSDSRRIFYRIEGKHPLNSGDRFDVAWQVGQGVGFLFGFVGLGGGTGKVGGADDQLIGKNGDPNNIDQGVTEGRPSDAFSAVERDCSPSGATRTIYTNRSRQDIRLTIDATTTCKQEFIVGGRTVQTLNTEARIFQLAVPSSQSINMKCTGSGTCAYRIRGFATAADISESCDFDTEPIYQNMTKGAITVTVEGRASCPQSFGVVGTGGTPIDDVDIMGETRVFSFSVPQGHSIMMFCIGSRAIKDCNYILAIPSGTPDPNQVACGTRATIHRNIVSEQVFTVQVTAGCDTATLLVGGKPIGEIPAGATRTRTFTVPRLTNIVLDCSGSGPGNCAYTLIEGE